MEKSTKMRRKVIPKGVIGVDEVGRGPLAGPVTVCAVYIEDSLLVTKDIFEGRIKDSKKSSPLFRNTVYTTITKHTYTRTKILYAISSKSARYIDKHGIQKAIQYCVDSCLSTLYKKGIDIYTMKIHMDAGLQSDHKNINQVLFDVVKS